MADSNIGALPLAPNVADDSLLVMEQQGTAMRLTGAMLKEYAKQGVELEFREDLEASKAAADRAEDAVSSVTDMTVSAHVSEIPTVAKSMQAGKVNLDFGLPRGERGAPGPAGQTGPRGPQGAPGNGLTILGHYDTEAELRAAVTAPEVGDAYGVGLEAPYDIYVFDGVTGDWKNNGPLSGGGGVIPENVVTSEGGAIIEMEGKFGDAPHTITFTGEEELPLTASDVEYDGAATGMEAGTVQEAVNQLFTSVSDGKALIASAVTDKGVPTQQDATFAEMAENIGQITAGGDTSDATATPGDILGGKTAYTASGKVEGIIPSLPAQTITPGTADKTIANGQYLAGTQTIKGDPNLTSSNIKKGVSLFGVAGALESSFAATLTVTADIGAVVTATCGDTSLEALSTTGTVVLELPIEGTWKVSAVRGMAQYNTVTLEVSNQYSAELTAELHIEYFGDITPLSEARCGLAAASVGNFALFGGGESTTNAGTNTVDSYDKMLTHGTPTQLQYCRYDLRAVSIGDRALFGGGVSSGYALNRVDAYDEVLTHSTPNAFGEARTEHGAAAIGDYALFGGGRTGETVSLTALASVEAYDKNLTKADAPTPLVAPGAACGASNKNYAFFYAANKVSAYDKNLTRVLPASDIKLSGPAARAGNYAIFVNDRSAIAYDLFLTRVEPEQMAEGKPAGVGVTLMDFALFGGQSGRYQNPGSVEVYDPYLVRTTAKDSSGKMATGSIAAAATGDHALFGGGEFYSSKGSRVSALKYV